MVRRCALTLALAASQFAIVPLHAQTPRPTGIVGSYVPPRVWAQHPRSFDLLHQRIAIQYDLDQRSLAGEVQTRLVVTGAPTDTIRLDASQLVIDGATDARGKKLRFTADTGRVTVRLARRAQAGDTVVFTLRYHGNPERGMYFVPRRRVMWTQGEATETHSWVPTYDAPNDKTTWEILVTADTGVSVLSNGRLVEVTPVAGGAKQVWHWSQELPASTYLYSIVAARVSILKDSWRGIPVEYWVAPDTVNAGWRTFGETPSMIETYSRVLGVNFPWAKYDQAVIPDFTYGGMENVSATTQTDQVLHSAAEEPVAAGRGLNAHELAHQWFGDLTTAADWAHIWLNEGLTTYMESVQEEHSRGWDAAELNWYQQQQQAMQADENEVRPLVWGTYRGTDPIVLFFSGHVYPKGAQLAHQLRRLLGDSVFWAGMRRFLSDNAYRPVTTPDFAVAMERTCNCDLDWFFDQWAYGIGYPRVQFRRHWAADLKTLHLIVSQTQPIDSLHPVFRFPATIRVITRDSVVRQEIMVSHQSDTFAIALPSEPLSFRFDEGGWLLGTVAGDLSPAELAPMAMHDLDIRGRRWALAQLDRNGDSLAAAARRFVVLNEHTEWLRQVAVRGMARDSSPASRAVVRSALRDPEPEVRAQALQTLTALDTVGGLAVAQAMYAADPSGVVRQTALATIGRIKGRDALDLYVAASGTDQSLGMRGLAASLMGRVRDPRSADALERLTAVSEDRGLRTGALDALAASDSARATALALRLVGDGDPLFASSAVRVVGRVGGEAGRARLREALAPERRVLVRLAMAQVLAGPARR
jgi:aminopeptidase N